jgi:type VI secretion system protein ImpJ
MPDGLVFEMPGSDDLPAGRNIQDYFPVDVSSLDIFLAIPENALRDTTLMPNDAPPTGAIGRTRYFGDVSLVRDRNDGTDETPVLIARRNFRLLFGSEGRDGYSTLRIGQISRTPAGTFALNSRFVPACLDIGASEYLMAVLRRQIEILASKAESLSATRRRQSPASNASEIADFLLVHAIDSCLPELQHIWSVRRGHPEPLFVALLRIAGSLLSFSAERYGSRLPIYDHDNLGPCFSALDERIRDLLVTTISSTFLTVPLQLVRPNVWSANIPETQYFSSSNWYLSVAANMAPAQLAEMFPKLAKAAAADETQILVRNALPGLALEHAPDPPYASPLRLGSEYFRVHQKGVMWDKVMLSHNLSVFVPDEIVEPRLELVVLSA